MIGDTGKGEGACTAEMRCPDPLVEKSGIDASSPDFSASRRRKL